MSGIDPEDMVVTNIGFILTLANKLASPFIVTRRHRSSGDLLNEQVIAACQLRAAENLNESLTRSMKHTAVKMDSSERGYLGGSLGL